MSEELVMQEWGFNLIYNQVTVLEYIEFPFPNKEHPYLANKVFFPARWNARQGLYHPKAVTFTLYLLSILFQDRDPLFLLQLEKQQVERPFIWTNTGTEGTQLWQGNNRVRRKCRVLIQAINFLCFLLKGSNRAVLLVYTALFLLSQQLPSPHLLPPTHWRWKVRCIIFWAR